MSNDQADEDPDFDLDMVPLFFDAARRHDRANPYFTPGNVTVKIGHYVSYQAMGEQLLGQPRREGAADWGMKVDLPIPGSKQRFPLEMKYYLAYRDLELKLVEDGSALPTFDEDAYTASYQSAAHRTFHFTISRVLGDPVHDDDTALAQAGFIYHDELTRMSASARGAYGRTLDEISYVPADSAPDSPIFVRDPEGDYYTDVGFQFKQWLARTCTYDSDGDYFKKWTPKALKLKHRSLIGPNLLPSYLARATGEYELEQWYYYALLTSDRIQSLYQLLPGRGREWALNMVVGLHDAGLIPPSDSQEFASLPRPELILFRAIHGFHAIVKGRGVRMPRLYYHHVHAGAFQRLADPQREVEADLGKKASAKLHARSDFDWFVELAKLRFTDSMYALNIKKAMRDARVDSVNDLAWLPEVRKKLAEEVGRAIAAWAGDNPIRISAVHRTQSILDDEELLLIPQGRMLSDDQKFVGLDADFAYLRDLKRDVTIKMPHAAFLAEMSERLKYNTMYENSEGVIYFSQLVVWGGLGAMGAALMPGLFVARTLYREIGKRLEHKLVQKAIANVVTYELPAIAALMAEVVSNIFGMKEWAAFSRGFFRGYALQTLKKVFLDISAEGMARAVFKEYDLYLRVKAIRQKLKQLQKAYETLSAKLTREHVNKLAEALESSVRHAGIGVLALFQAISFLEHRDAEDLLAGISAAVMDDPFDTVFEAEWANEAKDAVGTIVEGVGTYVTQKGDQFFDAVNGVFKFWDDHQDGIAAGVLFYTVSSLSRDLAHLSNFRDAPKTSPVKIVVVVLGVASAGAVAHYLTSGDSTRLVYAIGDRIFDALPGRDVEDAALRGGILGNLLGSVFFDHGMIGGASALGRLAKQTTIGKRVRKKVKVGILMPIVSALMHRYITFYRGLMGHAGASGDIDDVLKDLAHWRTDSSDLERFEDFRGTSDTGYQLYDIAVAVLKVDRFLDEELRARWTERWGRKLDLYEGDLKAFRADVHLLGIDALVKKHGPVVGHALLVHLKTAMREIRNGLADLVKQVGDAFDDGSRISLLRVYEMMVCEPGDLDGLEQEFDDDMVSWASDYQS